MKSYNNQLSTPVQTHERIEVVDILRGFAIFGILLINMSSFGEISYNLSNIADIIDKTTVVLLQFFAQAKFYSLFSFLFGWGISIQMARAASKGYRFLPLILRRLAILLFFGLIHGIFIWVGDILTTYAIMGLLLLLFKNRSRRTLLITALFCLGFSILLTLPGETLDMFHQWYAASTDFLRQSTFPSNLYATGTYAEIIPLRIEEFIGSLLWFIYWFGNIFSMFLLGLYAGKRRIFQNIQQHLPLIRRIMGMGLFIGMVFNGIFVYTNLQPSWIPGAYHRLATTGSRTIGAPALMLFYVGAIILLAQKKTWYSRLAPLAPVGRMALSNYLMQSVICTLIFYGYGFGLFGEFSPTVGLILSISIYLSQIRFSAWWMERYQFGPMEWLWRSLTYGKRQPLQHGQTLANLQPIPVLESLRRWIKRVPSAVALASVWVILLAWAASLIIWNSNLNDSGLDQYFASISETTPLPDDIAEAIPIGESPVLQGVATPIVQPAIFDPSPVVSSGNMDSLASLFDFQIAMTHIETLAGEEYDGRYAGTPGGLKAGEYIAEQFEFYGLQPAGNDGTFFQDFKIPLNLLSDIPSLAVEYPDGTRQEFVLFQDFSPVANYYTGSGNADGDVYWAGNCYPEVLRRLDVVDKIVLCQEIISTDEIFTTARAALEQGAAGLLLITDPEIRPSDFANRYNQTWVPGPLPTFRIFPDLTEELLAETGVTLDSLIAGLPPTLLNTRVHMKIETLDESACPTEGCQSRNILGVIPGRDPNFAHEIVILSGHYDHMGNSPDGTIWRGANDDASGIAILLEIARNWQEQGYVPRRTVLFAAWDAEELGLLGSTYYVENPQYPLDSTVGMLQLDMVGTGGEILSVSGEDSFESQILAVANFLNIRTEESDMGRSDHAPFWQAGVPASLLIWFDETTAAHYHRPADIPQVIEADKLRAAAHIAALTVLDLAENKPAILDILSQRAGALKKGDEIAFLATSHSKQLAADRFWFEEFQVIAPLQVALQATDLQVAGNFATALVHIHVETDNEAGGEINAELPVQFNFENNGWQWSGPYLAKVPQTDDVSGFDVFYPPDVDEDLSQLGENAANLYAAIARQMGLPTEPKTEILLHPSSESLRTSVALSLPQEQDSWVTPGKIQLVYSPEIETSEKLTSALAQLALAEANIPREAAPWLWEGLPLLLQAQKDIVSIQSGFLPELTAAFEGNPGALTITQIQGQDQSLEIFSAASWAASDTLLKERGWRGLGTFVRDLGQACHQNNGCQTEKDVDSAYQFVLGMDGQTFNAHWKNQWQTRLGVVQNNLDTLMAARISAVLSDDIASFLRTVDESVPNLLAAEENWFKSLANHPAELITFTAQPLTLYDNDHVLALVSLDFRLKSGEENSISQEVLFSTTNTETQWVGTPFETISGSKINVRYPEGAETLARAMQMEATALLDEIALTLNITPPIKLTLELFESRDNFRSSISLSHPSKDWHTSWTAPRESIKLYISPAASPDEYKSVLTQQISRQLLYHSEVESEWLLKGVSALITRPFDNGETYLAIGQGYEEVLALLERNELPNLSTLPPNHEISNEEEFAAARIAAWDSVRYLSEVYGWDALIGILDSQSQGFTLEGAIQKNISISFSAFEENWEASLSHGHVEESWYAIVQAFDGEIANTHIEFLSSPKLRGRQAGFQGDQAARDYIAEKFADYGLKPVGNIEESSYFQQFLVDTTSLTTIPRLEIFENEGSFLNFREDFLPLLSISPGDVPISGKLVWVQGNYEDVDIPLDEVIVVRIPVEELEIEIEQAIERGAVGLILVGSVEKEDVFSKKPEIYAYSSSSPIPVFELTDGGFDKFLKIMGHTPQSIHKLSPAGSLEKDAQMVFGLPEVTPMPTANVLGLLPGSDSILSQEVVIISAHYDHVGDDPFPGLRYSGANDNASGIGALLEIARVWQKTGYHPKRSVLFVAWGAQELEQAGSRYYAANPILPLENTMALIQMDGIAGGDGFYPGAQGEWDTDGLLLFGAATAMDFLEDNLIITPSFTPSDHFAFEGFGFPTLLFTWRLAGEDNLPDEFASGINPARLESSGELIMYTLMGIAR